MKALFLTLVSLASVTAYAGGPDRTLTCRESESSSRGLLIATLDSSGFSGGNDLFVVKDPNLSYQYSSARLICEGNRLNQINCVGIWFGQGDDIARVKTSVDANGNISATFNTAKPYKNISVTVPCTLE